jgi:hypothetical protein
MVEDVAATERRTRADDSEVVKFTLVSQLGVVSNDRANDGASDADGRAGAHDGILDDATR